MRCWVLFSGTTELWYLRLLKPGFRHCFVVYHDGQRWLSIDPLAHFTEVIAHDLPPSFNVIRWLESQGMTAVEVPYAARAKRRALWPAFFTCVEAVKRMVALHSFWTITPYQLYQRLSNKQ